MGAGVGFGDRYLGFLEGGPFPLGLEEFGSLLLELPALKNAESERLGFFRIFIFIRQESKLLAEIPIELTKLIQWLLVLLVEEDEAINYVGQSICLGLVEFRACLANCG